MRNWFARMFGKPQEQADDPADVGVVCAGEVTKSPSPCAADAATSELGFAPQWHACGNDGAWFLRPTTSAMAQAPRTRLLADIWHEEAHRIVQAGGTVKPADAYPSTLFATAPEASVFDEWAAQEAEAALKKQASAQS